MAVIATVFCIASIGAIAAIFYFLLKSTAATQLRNTTSIQKELSSVTNRVNQYLTETARLNQESGAGTVKAIGDVYTRLGALEESTHKIYRIGEDIAKLQELLKAPKTRGGFGEWMLQDLLEQMIPKDHFRLQYQFRGGARVDAALLVGDYVVSVDAKFPLENFERYHASVVPDEKKKLRREFSRDVKKHIDAISERYIVPEEGTLDFALMYIPAESVYYEMITRDEEADDLDLYQYSTERCVIPISPNSFYAYLQVILMGLRGLRVDEQARQIARSLEQMRGDFKKIVEDLEVLGSHLNRAQGGYERVRRGTERFDEKLTLLDFAKVPVPEIESSGVPK